MVSGTHESPALGKIYRFLEVFNTGDPAQFQHFADEHYAKRSGRDLVAFLQLATTTPDRWNWSASTRWHELGAYIDRLAAADRFSGAGLVTRKGRGPRGDGRPGRGRLRHGDGYASLCPGAGRRPPSRRPLYP